MKSFTKLKKQAPFILNSLKIKKKLELKNQFIILGMPRSGTTLVEQIISAQSKVPVTLN